MNAMSVTLLPNFFFCVCVSLVLVFQRFTFLCVCHALFMHFETLEFRNSKHLSVTSILLDKT